MNSTLTTTNIRMMDLRNILELFTISLWIYIQRENGIYLPRCSMQKKEHILQIDFDKHFLA